MKKSLLYLVVVLLLAACGKSTCKVSIGDVRSDIYLYGPDAYNLLHAGGAVYAHGGHKGMWIVNTGMDFVVFEATCPHCDDTAVDTVSGWNGILQCPKCTTMFMTYTDGYPVDGGATPCALYQYSCVREGDYLHIYN